MSLGSSLDTKERVREAIEIVDLVGKYVQLRRRGRLYVGLCPWHDDTRPSLQVNPERQSFKCWVCDIGGDVFSFVMKMEGVSFPEALAMLAEQAGIPLKPYRRSGGQQAAQAGAAAAGSQSGQPAAEPASTQSKQVLYQAMAWAEQEYHRCLLHSQQGEPARRYLHQRRISPASIEKFHLGFSPNQPDWILQRGRAAGLGPEVLEAVGLLARSADGRSLYDRFRGRLVFSIRDLQDRPVGLGGRVLPELAPASRAKYINSPETPLFTKSAHLYGQDVARAAMRKTGTALLVEGYTDCIIAHQYGFENAVAVLGTALTQQHVRILKRFVERIVLVLDGDEAGRRRANEVLGLFLAENVDLQVLTLPEGTDPADFLTQRGPEAFSDLVKAKAIDALQHAFQVKTRGVHAETDVHGATRALEEMLSIIASGPRPVGQRRLREEKTLSRLALLFRVPEEAVRQRLTALRRTRQRQGAYGPSDLPPERSAAASKPTSQIDPWQQELLEILIQQPQCVALARAEIDPGQLDCPLCRQIYQTCCRLDEAGIQPTFERLILEFDDPAIKSLLVHLDEQGRAKGIADGEPLLRSLIASFQHRKALKLRPVNQGALREGRLDEAQQLDLLRTIEQQERARQRIARNGP